MEDKAAQEDTVGAACTPHLTPHPLHLLSRKEVSSIKPILVLIPGNKGLNAALLMVWHELHLLRAAGDGTGQ